MSKLKGWKEIPIGGIIPSPGTAEDFKTGNWRAERPIINQEECINCALCVISCPDDSILTDTDGNISGIDLDYCKGCGICASKCPKKAITMEQESKFN